MRSPVWLVVAAAACTAQPTPSDSDTDLPGPDLLNPPAPPLLGPGGPQRTFAEAELWQRCAHLPGNLDRTSPDGVFDVDHHNLVVPWRGYLMVPWAAEWGGGGLTFWDVADPCAPTKVGEGRSPYMRETHSVGFVHLPEGDPHAGDWAAVDLGGAKAGIEGVGNGVQFWDISDPTNPVVAGELALPDVIYPDSYERINLSLSWQYPWVYVASATIGIHVIDATDPTAPVLARHVDVPDMRVGGVFAFGDTLLLTGSEQRAHAMYDISVPDDPQPIPGGRFDSLAYTPPPGWDEAAQGAFTPQPVEAYHANRVGPWALFARKEGAGGPIVYDISDPAAPTYVGEQRIDGMSGGYVFYDEGFLFTGDSNGAHITDFRDPANPSVVGTILITDGDLDTLTPYGNVVIAALDDPGSYDDIQRGEASIVVPWQAAPDTTAPALLLSWPRPDQAGVPITARLGLSFNEFIEPSLAVDGVAFRLWEGDIGDTRVPCWGSAEETRLHVTPKAPLAPGTRYVLEVLDGVVQDVNGNAAAGIPALAFTTAE